MNSTVVAIVLLLAGLGVFWPSIGGLLSKLKGMLANAAPVIRGGDSPISRDAAVAGLLTAMDYAHAAGRHEVCATLAGCLGDLSYHKEQGHK